MTRISILSGDPGHAALKQLRDAGKVPRVYLDGERIEGCITADEHYGFVTVVARGEDGEPLDWRDPLNRRNRRGEVEIRPEAEQRGAG